jgi:hypothetical protein
MELDPPLVLDPPLDVGPPLYALPVGTAEAAVTRAMTEIMALENCILMLGLFGCWKPERCLKIWKVWKFLWML